MSKQLHFTYESAENLTRLLINIRYEQTHSNREISIYHERFDDESDNFFYDIMCKLYHDGITIGQKEIDELVEYIHKYLETDESTADIRMRYRKRDIDTWVYFKLDKTLFPCKTAEHTRIVKEIAVDYFKDVDPHSLTQDMVTKFIVDNIEIKSEFSTIEKIATDRYIYQCCCFNRDI